MRIPLRAGRPRAGFHRLAAGAVTLGMTAATVGGVLVSPAAAVPNPLAYQVFAFAGYSTLGGVVQTAPLLGAGVDCTSAPGVERVANGAVNIPGVLSVNAANQSATTSERAPGAQQVGLSISTLDSVDVLDGLVGLTGLSVASGAVNTGSGITTNGTVSLDALTILGIPFPLGAIGPNTVVGLPGVVSITLNQQTPVSSGLQTIGARIKVLSGPGAGLDIALGFTQAGFGPKPPVFVTGGAYSNVIIAGPVSVSPIVAQGIPCTGGVSSSSALGIDVPGVLTTGAITATGGSLPGDPTYGAGVLDIAGVNILGGLITADAIRSQANVIKSPGSPAVVDATGTTFTNLVIAGQATPSVVPPNTGIVLPGVGYVILNRQIATANSIEVRAIEVVVTVAGVLPVNAVIRLGVAGAQASDDGLSGGVSTLTELSAPEGDRPLDDYVDDTCEGSEDSAKCLGVALGL